MSAIAGNDRTLYLAFWILFWMIPPLRRVPPQAPPPRWSVKSGTPPWRGPWGPRIRRARALIAASTAGTRARMSAQITADTTTTLVFSFPLVAIIARAVRASPASTAF
eukprot:3621963-Pyramimonas_sp.AAC.1